MNRTPIDAARLDEVHRQIAREFGAVAEPFTLHRPVPALLVAAWSTFRETVVARGRLRRAMKEAAAMAISASNRCGYCVDAHAAVLHGLGERRTERAIRGRGGHGDPEIAAFVAWAEATRRADAEPLRRPPFGPAEQPEAVGTALCFHYINRMATALLGETPLPTRSRRLRGPLLRIAGLYLSRRARAEHRPGESLRFLPAVEGPAYLGWAAGSPAIAGAFARFAAAIDDAVADRLAPPTRERVLARLDRWRGEDPPFGDDWVREVTEGLEPAQGAAARLALLAALAPHRASGPERAAFTARWPADADLVATLAWGSFHAARRISEWSQLASADPVDCHP
ncbi:MAG TPA: carboxymuconolactone decarboxylase family protein [Thermoanaerobaculia bacterium]|nr:carboxymuconolactone decarboxylase family protein [Thermoanaerobaculia bacterium]